MGSYRSAVVLPIYAVHLSRTRFTRISAGNGAVRTFEGRLDMLRAASDVYSEHYPNPALQTQFKTFAGQMKNIAGRRNDIAHGIVARWYLPGESFLSE